LIRRIVKYGHGFNPLGRPKPEDISRLRHAMAAGGRSIEELEMVGGTRGVFRDASSVADLQQALSSIPEQLDAGFTSICIKPSQFIDDPGQVGAFCREVVERVSALVG
jgi:hypothetical protein